MANAPCVKFDDGSTDTFAANCFPVRGLIRHAEDASGAWLFEQRAEQRRRFKAVLCTKPKTYAQIKEERKRADREGIAFNPADIQNLDEDEEQPEAPALDGFFLMRHCCIEDPSDLCSVNISGKELSEYKEEDFALFDNVAYVNASENYLPFEAFRGFPIIRELEIPLNGLRSIRLSPGDYPTLEIVDISYNNLSQEDVLSIGTLPNLKVLHLTGNNFRSLPPDMALPYHDTTSNRKIPRFRNLEILMLDDNRLCNVALFAALAGLRRLRHLNLEKNEIFYVPQLKSVEGSMIVSEDDKDNERLKKSPKSGKKSSRTPRPQKIHNRKKSDHTADGSSSDPIVPVPNETSLPVPANSEVISNDNIDTEDKTDDGNKESKKENTEVDLNEDFGDLSKTLEDLDINTELPSMDPESVGNGKNPVVDNFAHDPKGPPLPPFPELRYLNLSHNLIAEEEALLSVAAWPMLSEILISNNPLTTEKSGDPPLLKRFLQDRLGIQLIRKKATETAKPTIDIPSRKSRKVSSHVPKIPKVTLEERLMLEPPPPPRPPSTPKPSQRKALPPIKTSNVNYRHSPSIDDNIPSTPDYQRKFSEQSEGLPDSAVYKRQFSEQSEGLPDSAVYKRQFSEQSEDLPESANYRRQFSEESEVIPDTFEYKRKVSEESEGLPESAVYKRAHSETPQSIPEVSAYSRQFSPEDIPASSSYKRPYSAGAKRQQKETVTEKPESKSAWSEEQPDQAFFMTQVDDQGGVQEKPQRKVKPVPQKIEKVEEKKVDNRYKGYEILLDYEDDPNFMDPHDMQGNVRALKYALGHELVYRDAAARLDRIHKPVPPYRKWEMPPKVQRKTKGERVDDVLTKLKNRETLDEANLSRVLKDRQSKKKQFPEAQTLLAEIQKRYNTVRVNSMKEARDVKKIITGTAHDLSKKGEPLKAT